MNKKRFLLLSVLMLLVVVSFVQAASLSETLSNAGNRILEYGSFNFLKNNSDKFLGFMRIMVGILIFTFLYLILSMARDKVPKNIATIVAIVVAIMTLLFIPDAAILTFGATLGMAASFIMYSLLILPATWFIFKDPTETRLQAAMKLAVLGIIVISIAGVNSAVNDITGGKLLLAQKEYNLGEFGGWANDIATYAYFIFFFLAAYLVWKFIFPKGSSEKAWRLAKGAHGYAKKPLGEIWEDIKDFTGRKDVQKIKKYVKRENTKLLDEYIEEKNELQLIDEALDHAEEFDKNAKGLSEGKVSLKDIRNNLKDLKDAVDDAEREISRLKSRTFRQERQYQKLRKALEEAKVKISSAEKQKMEANEHDMLYQHRLVVNSMKKVSANLSSAATELSKNKTEIDAKQLQVMAATIHKELGNARASQEQAYKEAEGLLAIFRKYWK